MMLGSRGGGPVDLELASAHNTEVLRAKRRTMKALDLATDIEDIIVTLGDLLAIVRFKLAALAQNLAHSACEQ